MQPTKSILLGRFLLCTENGERETNCKNCQSCQSQVTWKVKLKYQLFLSCLSRHSTFTSQRIYQQRYLKAGRRGVHGVFGGGLRHGIEPGNGQRAVVFTGDIVLLVMMSTAFIFKIILQIILKVIIKSVAIALMMKLTMKMKTGKLCQPYT